METANWLQVLLDATGKGMEAGLAVVPNPMIVESGGNIYTVNEGMCGFAWVKVYLSNSESRQFINKLKTYNLAVKDTEEWEVRQNAVFTKSIDKGYQMWVHQFNQSYERKRAYAQAFAEHLRIFNINAYAFSRLD